MEISGYRDLQEVHRGHRFLVIRGRRVHDDRAVVIKTITPGPGAAGSAQTLHHEHAVLAALAGTPGIARALALVGTAAAPILVLEDAGPFSLGEWLRRRPLDLATFLPLAVRLAEIVGALHASQVVHRDVNPSNVVLDAGATEPTLVDFDAAATFAGVSSGGGAAEGILGTLAYLAPEQTGRMGRVVDHRADLYALGVTFYEMLTGAPPFVSSDPVELVHSHLARPPVPPSALDPKLPTTLSDLVLKLLAKMPEERYQSAGALAADLQLALTEWRASGKVTPFVLGRGDLAHRLSLPSRLYGREAELARLLESFERAAGGASELLVVEGPAGIGKSALVQGLARRMDPAAGKGFFIWGKFEQLPGDIPYCSLVEALRRLCRGWLDGPEAARALWRRPLLDALGRNARVMTDLIPELGQVLGELPPAPELGPVETESRFHLTFSAFVRTLAQRLRPLVLLVDDAQWADPASLKLVGLLATDPDIHHLLLVVTLRSEEVGAEHPVTDALEVIRAAGGKVLRLPVVSLEDDAVTAMCADTLHGDPGDAKVKELGRLVRRKTGGNAFFVGRFLLYLHQAALLRWQGERGRWDWDPAAIASAEVTENVLGLMLEAIRRLPAQTQRVLEMAACFRRRVDLRVLARLVGEADAARLAGHLWSAIQEGLLVPDGAEPSVGQGRDGETIHYRFVHDRVQQAAYSLLPEQLRRETHLAIGRLLLLGAQGVPDPGGGSEALFEVVDQFRPAVDLITDPVERLRLAELNLEAGTRAQATSAHGPALAYLSMAIDLFPPEARAAHPDRLFQLYRQALQLAELTGDQARAEELSAVAFALARDPVEQAGLHSIRIVACSMRGAYLEAIAQGRQALALLGLDLLVADPGTARSVAGNPPGPHLQGRRPGELLNLPRMHDARQLASMQLLANLLDPAYVCDPALLAVLVQHMVELSLSHGNSVHSAFAYTVHGMIIAVRDGDHATAHAFGCLGVDLARAFGDPVQECRTLHIFGAFVNHWRAPVASSLPRLRLAVARALEAGDLHYGVYADYTAITVDLHRGVELGQIAGDLESALALTRKIRVKASLGYLVACGQAIRCLQGRTRARTGFDDESFDEASHLAACEGNPIALWLYQVLRLQCSYLLGDLEEAQRWSQRADAHRRKVGGLISVVDHNFYTSLVLAANAERVAGPDPSARRSRMLGQIAENQQQLAAWAASCGQNFLHKHLLVAAEVARLMGNEAEAAEKYDQAIDAAQREGFLHDQALGSELAGRHHRGLGRKRIGDFYLRAAIEGFARWGAMSKVAALEEEFPHLAELPWRAPLPTIGADGRALDLLSLLKAAGTISGEVVLERLIERLLTICFEVGGAARGALLLEETSGLVVRAVGSLTGAPLLEGTPLELSPEVPRTLIEHVHRNAEALVLGDAARQGPFAADPYIHEHKVKSALALPIRHHARSIGVLYLENNLAAHSFTAARLRVLTLLSSQMAISLENSLLFGRLNLEIDERKRAEAKAQDLVRSRDDFLSIASHELKTPVTSLSLALQVLAKETGKRGTSVQTQLAQVAERQVGRLRSLIDDLLDVSRIRAGRLQLTYETVELGAVVRDAVEGFASELAEARCTVMVRSAGPIAGRWSRARLDQVVINLISNAIKFGRAKPIEIELHETPDQASITIVDHGIGIAADRLPHIFERFERAVSTSHYGGLGLGLYIAREIVEALGGSIRAESALGLGATFVVTLPKQAPRDHLSTLFAPPDPDPATTPDLKVV